MIGTALAMVEPALRATDAEAASMVLRDAVVRIGATYLQTRLYTRPAERLTPEAHWRAGGFVVRMARDGWAESDAFRYVCLECNPLVGAVRQARTTYRFGDYAPRSRGFGRYWDALAEGAIGDAICATAYGADRRIASIHLGFGTDEPDPSTARALQLAALLLAERLLAFAPATAAAPAAPVALTPRERDALGFVADGKTDWEIATILGVAEATARFHVDNARRKLGAHNRAHAVARLVALEGPF